ncbi:hypothetical protein vseg_013894 [Gypsophila vaccaria]
MLLHGREGVDNRKRSRHMWSVSPAVAASPGVNSNGSSGGCFFRDGRKISIGDCALFKPVQDRPPFVGIIRSLTSDQESNITLGVNRLYRTAEVKLLKGVALEAAPNEVFYSFHRDEIPAASLLHPCKVAFLRKGAELPAGVASFVCRRVYDITNKCFWWLSDRDFIDERQEEVDKLLQKTGIEMHASVQLQQGPRSPKLPNSSPATSPQNHSPDSVQNSTNLFSKRKVRKRDRVDQLSEPTKREQIARPDSGRVNPESSLNVEIAKVAERGLVNPEAVAGLVRLMQPESSRRKIDLAGRSMLVGIIAATDNLDYLTQFVQLKGLVVLDEWLQEVHKGKVGDPGNVNNSDKCVENFLLVLLRALVKLPVNLYALQMCNIGKSVNYLRSHKNSEIQKKAKSLVDTWKKRVEAEMSVNDETSAYGQAVPSSGRSKDDSHGIAGYKNSSGSYEAAIQSSVTRHSSMKSSSVKLAQEGSNVKSGSAYQSNVRPPLSNLSTIPDCKNGQSRISVDGRSSEPPQTVAREEHSSSSSPSHTHSQCSSDHVKYLVPCGKVDAKRFITDSKNLNKATGKDSKHRRLSKAHNAGVIKETATNRSSHIEQVPHNVTDGLVRVGNADEGSNHKLSADNSNRVWRPDQSTVAASANGFPCRNGSSPVISEMHGKSDSCLNTKHDSHQTDGTGGSLAAEHQRSIDTSQSPNVANDAYSIVRNEMKQTEAHHSSFSSIDVLIETCVRLSEVVVTMSDGDDFGVNLLASVATGDFSNSGVVSPAISLHKPSTIGENSSIHDIVDEKQVHADDLIQLEDMPSDDVRTKDCNINSGAFEVNDGGSSQTLGIANEEFLQKEEGCLRDNRMSDEQVAVPCTTGRSEADMNDIGGDVNNECCHVKAGDKLKDLSLDDESKNATHGSSTYPSINDNYVVKVDVYVEPECNGLIKQNPSLLQSESRNTDEMPLISSRTSQNMGSVNATINVDKTVSVELCDHADEEGILPKGLHSSTNGGEYRGNPREDCGVTTADAARIPAIGGSDVDAKHGFDLNEGFNDEGKHMEPVAGPCHAAVFSASPLQVHVSTTPVACPTSNTVTTAAKGTFVPSDDLLRSQYDPERKGLVSTSVLPLCLSEVPYPDGATCRQARPPLDIDLNIADKSSDQESDVGHDSVCELTTTASLRSSKCFEFDLNEIDEASDIVEQPGSNNHRVEVSIPSVKQSPSSNVPNGKSSSKRDFDLNDGPVIEEIPVEQTSYIQPFCNNMPLQSSFGPRISPSDAGSFSVWNPQRNYSVSVSPSTLPDRETFPIAGISGGLHHIMGGPASSLSFYPDAYRGSVVASSLAMPFQPAPYQYPIFPFGSSCSLPTSALAGGPSVYMDPAAGGRFSAIPSQLVGNGAAISFQYPHAYGVQRPIHDVSNNGVFDSNERWGKLGLDLNSGPGGVDLEWRNGLLPTVSVPRQVSAINLRPLVKEQTRMCSVGGGILKRKEPDGGWNVENG